MGTIHLPPDFREFFRWLNHHDVEYLLIGGYAVGYHGYPRATIDIDVWIAPTPQNAKKVVAALEDFGFGSDVLVPDLFVQLGKIFRMGLPPMRIEILTSISGVEFTDVYADRIEDELDGVPVKLINLHYLKLNKKAAARAKDLADLEELP